MIPVLGLALGVVAGLLFQPTVPTELHVASPPAPYMSAAAY